MLIIMFALISFQPEDLIPVLDLSGVNNTEAEAITEENDFPSKLKESNSSVEIRSDLQISSPKFVSSPQFRCYIIYSIGRFLHP